MAGPLAVLAAITVLAAALGPEADRTGLLRTAGGAATGIRPHPPRLVIVRSGRTRSRANPIFASITMHRVAWVGGVHALSPTRVAGYAVRTYSGCPKSNMRFRTLV